MAVKSSAIIDGVNYIPPQKHQLAWLIAKEEKVREYFESDTDQQLYLDLVAYLKNASEQPSENHYKLLAQWTMHTSLHDRVQYSPMIYFYAVAARGKTRTGKALLNAAWRGVHVASMKEAHVIRLAENQRATIFFDMTDFQKKMGQDGSEDIIFGRFEKGPGVPRVLYPEKGAFDDTVYYEVYGPTILCSNEPINHILETRAIEIVMPESSRKFDNNIDPNEGLVFRERLLAFRGRWIDRDLPVVSKPTNSRLGDILSPLRQINTMISQDETWFLEFTKEIDQARKEEQSDTREARVIRSILAVSNEICKRSDS